MNIIVCIKQVPDTTEVKMDQKTGTLIREGIPVIINPDDKAAIEVAIQLKEKHGGTVTVLTMGPPQAEQALKEAYAMGADKVILLSDKAFAGSDTWATSLTLAHAVKSIGNWGQGQVSSENSPPTPSQEGNNPQSTKIDLIICGRQAIDGDTAQVGPQLAEHLGLPQVSYVTEIDRDEGRGTSNQSTNHSPQSTELIVKKVFEDGYQRIRVKTPCLLTVLREMNHPRYMTVSRIFDSCQHHTVEKMTINDIDLDPVKTGLKASPTQVRKIITKEAKKAGKVHELDARESAHLIVEKFKEKYII